MKPRNSVEYLNQRRVQELLAKSGAYAKVGFSLSDFGACLTLGAGVEMLTAAGKERRKVGRPLLYLLHMCAASVFLQCRSCWQRAARTLRWLSLGALQFVALLVCLPHAWCGQVLVAAIMSDAFTRWGRGLEVVEPCCPVLLRCISWHHIYHLDLKMLPRNSAYRHVPSRRQQTRCTMRNLRRRSAPLMPSAASNG